MRASQKARALAKGYDAVVAAARNAFVDGLALSMWISMGLAIAAAVFAAVWVGGAAVVALTSPASSMPSAAAATDPAKPTVESLVKEGYEMISVFPSTAGPGMLLEFDDENGPKLMMCFVAETPQRIVDGRADVALRACTADSLRRAL